MDEAIRTPSQPLAPHTPSARYPVAMTLDELRKKAKGTRERLWWSRRFLDVVGEAFGRVSAKDRAFATDCFVLLANADADWALKATRDLGPQAHSLSTVLNGKQLLATLKRLKHRDVAVEGLLRAKVVDTCVHWGKDAGRRASFLKAAWKELQRVPADKRGAEWKDAALRPASELDYPTYRVLALEKLSGLTEEFWRSSFLPDVIAVSFRHKDWPTFEKCIADYRAFPESLQRDHASVAVCNYEGLRALDEARFLDAEAAMRRVLALAPSTQFLSNEDVSALPKRLKKEGRNPDLTAAFDELVKARDWRILKS